MGTYVKIPIQIDLIIRSIQYTILRNESLGISEKWITFATYWYDTLYDWHRNTWMNIPSLICVTWCWPLSWPLTYIDREWAGAATGGTFPHINMCDLLLTFIMTFDLYWQRVSRSRRRCSSATSGTARTMLTLCVTVWRRPGSPVGWTSVRWAAGTSSTLA